MSDNATDALAQMIEAYLDGGEVRTSRTSRGTALQVWGYGTGTRLRKVGPLLFPREDQTIGECLNEFLSVTT